MIIVAIRSVDFSANMKRSFFLFTVLLITVVMALLSSTILLISQSTRGGIYPLNFSANMKRSFSFIVLLITVVMALLSSTILLSSPPVLAGQVSGAIASPDIPVSHHDRVYTADQFSNTISVTDPIDNKLLGVIRLGDPVPGNLSPLYHGQLLVHGMGFSPDHHTIVVVSIGSNSVAFIDTATNAIKHITYIGRSPHEAFFTPDGKEV